MLVKRGTDNQGSTVMLGVYTRNVGYNTHVILFLTNLYKNDFRYKSFFRSFFEFLECFIW